MENIEYVYTRGMSDSELTEQLASTNTGVLSLADDGDAYGIPLAHHYEDDHLYFRLGITEGSKKQRFIEETTTATYVVYGDTGAGGSWEPDSWSIIATGRLVELPATKEAASTTSPPPVWSPIRPAESPTSRANPALTFRRKATRSVLSTGPTITAPPPY